MVGNVVRLDSTDRSRTLTRSTLSPYRGRTAIVSPDVETEPCPDAAITDDLPSHRSALQAGRSRDIRQLLTTPGPGVVAARAILRRLQAATFIDRPLPTGKRAILAWPCLGT